MSGSSRALIEPRAHDLADYAYLIGVRRGFGHGACVPHFRPAKQKGAGISANPFR